MVLLARHHLSGRSFRSRKRRMLVTTCRLEMGTLWKMFVSVRHWSLIVMYKQGQCSISLLGWWSEALFETAFVLKKGRRLTLFNMFWPLLKKKLMPKIQHFLGLEVVGTAPSLFGLFFVLYWPCTFVGLGKTCRTWWLVQERAPLVSGPVGKLGTQYDPGAYWLLAIWRSSRWTGTQRLNTQGN